MSDKAKDHSTILKEDTIKVYIQRNSHLFNIDFATKVILDDEYLAKHVDEELLAMKPKRKLDLTDDFTVKGRVYKGADVNGPTPRAPSNIQALAIFLAGDPIDEKYAGRAHQNQPFKELIVAPKEFEHEFEGACASCVYQGMRSKCSYVFKRRDAEDRPANPTTPKAKGAAKKSVKAPAAKSAKPPAAKNAKSPATKNLKGLAKKSIKGVATSTANAPAQANTSAQAEVAAADNAATQADADASTATADDRLRRSGRKRKAPGA